MMKRPQTPSTAVRRERTRAVVALAVAGLGVWLVFMVSGAVTPILAIAGASASLALALLYLLGAAQSDRLRARRGEIGMLGAPSDRFASDAERAELVFELLPDPVIVVGRPGRVEAANAAARAWFTLSRPGVLFSTLMREPVVLEGVREALFAGATQTVEFMTMAPRERYLRAFIAPIETGEASEARREAARAVVVLYDHTAAKRVDRTRVDFLANASHQLRTPLASLTGFIETLRGHARDDADARERFLAIMQTQGERMRRLIDDLLSLSRIELNEHVPPTGSADLAEIAREVVDGLAPMASENGVTIELATDCQSAPVLGDREGLAQVVQNLVDNAVKYSGDNGRVTVTIGCGAPAEAIARAAQPTDPKSAAIAIQAPPDSARGAYAWLTVRDSGPGIAPRYLPRLAERFYRVDDAELQPPGTGLGLAIVKHIMSRHRGGFVVESKKGEGSAFTIYAPHTAEFAGVLGAETSEAAQ